MLSNTVARRYASALYASALATKETLIQLRELKIVSKLLADNSQLNESLTSPTVARQAKKRIIKEVFDGQISVRTFNFLFVLIDKGREAYYDRIVDFYEEQLCEDNGIVKAEVSSAIELDDQMRIFVETHLSQMTGKRIKLTTDVDPELIGGLVIRFDGRLYDGSIKRHLENMKARMRKG
ncbi:ATP synthase F1 subunit delta [bacterium]|nr:ATP synthase F1 subunit delta [bacterium]